MVIGVVVWFCWIWLYYCCYLFVVDGEKCGFFVIYGVFLVVGWSGDYFWLFWLVVGGKILGCFVMFDCEFVDLECLCVVVFC